MEVQIGSKKYSNCEKFGITEFADLKEWMQERREDRIIKRAKKVYTGDLPDKVFDEINKELTLDDIDEALEHDIQAMIRIIFLVVSKNNPDVTYEEVSASLGDMDSVYLIIQSLSPTGVPKKKVIKKKPKRKKRPTKKS